MGGIIVQLTVINTKLFLLSFFNQTFIYLFFISKKWYTFICETAFTNNKQLAFCVVVFPLWGS